MNKQKQINYDYYKKSNDIFSLIKDRDWSVFLCSNQEYFTQERFDIISSDPIKKVFAYQNATIVESNGEKKVYRDDPMKVLHLIMQNYSSKITSLPFTGGAIGYFSYDLGNKYESIKQEDADENIPLMAFGIYDWAIIIDHELKKTTLIYSVENEFIIKLKNHLKKKSFPVNQNNQFDITSKCTSNLTYDDYLERFNLIKSYIENGDCYQVNFAQRFTLDYKGDTWGIFNKILPSYHSPFSAYMNFPFVKILSFSPERFLSIKDNIVETKPIKGTRPISNNPHEDNIAKEELIKSKKEKAENLMIVDLLRNDLGRNCEYGSIIVKKLFSIETFANVHHLVSTIQGKMSKDSNVFKLIKGCFPGGSITGAPKIRSMQIINEVEPNRRSIYCGSIGYISSNQRVDLNIAIRTVIASNNKLHFWGGGGIVYDSDVKSEYKETLDKIKPILDLLGINN